MKKYIIIGSFLAVLAVPSVTMAAWYNPLTWFKKGPVSVTMPVAATSTTVVTNPAPETLPVPKPIITNTITVTDPKLQSQINALEQTNATLQSELTSLTAQYNSLVSLNSSLNSQLATLQTEQSTPSTPVQVQPVTTNNLVVNRLASSDTQGAKAFTFENDSNSDETVTGITVSDYYTTSPIQAQLSTGTGNPNMQNYDGSNGSTEVDFQNSIVLSPNSKQTFYLYGVNLKNITGIIRSGPDSLVGLPILVADVP